MTAQVDAQLVYMQPHMHLRGKDYELRAVFPDGKSEVLFKAKWDFNWQIGYDLAKPIALPKGTRIIGVAHYDNSANNKFNPDPKQSLSSGAIRTGKRCRTVSSGILIDPKIDPTDSVQAVGTEPVAARGLRADARVAGITGTKSGPDHSVPHFHRAYWSTTCKLEELDRLRIEL